MIPWYVRSFGREYLELYRHRDDEEAANDIKALIELVGPRKDKPLLDLGCGAGRHLAVLHEQGFTELVGLDLSTSLLEAAKLRFERQGISGIELVEGDMRRIPYTKFFSTVISMFTSIGYFQEESENAEVVDAVWCSLCNGGVFVIDYMNRTSVIDGLVREEEKVVDGKTLRIRRWLTNDEHRVEKDVSIISPDGSEKKFHESVRLYSDRELTKILQQAGFQSVRTYGSLSGEKLTENSERTIFVATKER